MCACWPHYVSCFSVNVFCCLVKSMGTAAPLNMQLVVEEFIDLCHVAQQRSTIMTFHNAWNMKKFFFPSFYVKAASHESFYRHLRCRYRQSFTPAGGRFVTRVNSRASVVSSSDQNKRDHGHRPEETTDCYWS